MSFPGFAIGVQQEEQARARKQELADEKRKVLLKTLQEDAETPQDKVDAIQAVYHQDPSVLKQHVENLTRRLTGKGAQPVVSPADAQAGRLAPMAARGKTPAQQQEAQYERETDYQNQAGLSYEQQQAQQKQQRDFALIDQYVTDPEQNKAMKQAYVQRVAEGTARPSADQQKRGDYQALVASGQVPKDAKGNPLSYEAWAAYSTAQGRAAGTPTKAPTVNREYADLYSKALLAKHGGAPLTPEESAKMQADYHAMVDAGVARMAALASAQAAANVVDATDPNTGASVKVTRAQAIAAANAGQPYGASALSTPGQTEKNRQDFANSGILQIQTLRDVLKRHPEFFGPAGGRATNFSAWLGSVDPDAQRFRTAALILADHSAGVFGGRSVKTVDELQKTITDLNLNAPAILSGLDVDEGTFKSLAGASGRLPYGNPGAPAPRSGGSGKGGTVHFTEGSDSWDIPSDKVKAFKAKHPKAQAQ